MSVGLLVDLPWRAKALCRGVDYSVFFPENLNDDTIGRARAICVNCPVFNQCQAWARRNYDDLPDGILYGCGPDERRRDRRRPRTEDWRTEKRISLYALAAREREALRRNDGALAGLVGYPEADADERQVLIGRYHDWLGTHGYPCSLAESEERTARLGASLAGIANRFKTTAFAERPACPAGHPPACMNRERRTRDGREVWRCYHRSCDYRLTLAS